MSPSEPRAGPGTGRGHRANMSRRHYEMVAKVIYDTILEARTRKGIAGVDPIVLLAMNLATMFKADNPRFDQQKFFVWCGLAKEEEE